jgi:hypothetical protein
MNRPSNRWLPVLLLTALFAFLAVAQAGAQTTPAPAAPVVSTADFLASLSAVPASGQDGLTPSPVLASGCTSNDQCPAGQLCCLACGYAGCETYSCFAPMRGHCPLFP